MQVKIKLVVFNSNNCNTKHYLKYIKVGVLELVDSFHLGWNGFYPYKFKSCCLYKGNIKYWSTNGRITPH